MDAAGVLQLQSDKRSGEQVWHGRAVTDYYGLPPVKHSHYRWTAGASFFLAGTAGAIEVLATIIDLKGNTRDRSLVRKARYFIPVAVGAASMLYIKDLGTPARWFNMLRIFRPTSFMSIGSWSLTTLGASAGAAAIVQFLEGNSHAKKRSMPARMASMSGLLPASLLTFYMGSELEETSTPFWFASSPLLPPFFAVSNVLNALSVLELLSSNQKIDYPLRHRIERFAVTIGIAELIILKMVENRWVHAADDMLLRNAHKELLYRTGLISIARAVSMVLRKLGMRLRSRSFLAAASAMSLAAGVFIPAELLFAGNRSADRSRDYFSYTDTPVLSSGKAAEDHSESNRQRHPMAILVGFGFGAWLMYAAINRLRRR